MTPVARAERIDAPPRRRKPVEDDPFAPVGVRAGSFILRPALEVTGGYDTNPGRIVDGSGSPVLIVAPELAVRSEWQRHSLTADLRGTYTAYSNTPSLSAPTFNSKVDGRIDMGQDSRIDLEARLAVSTESPGSANVPSSATKPVYATTFGGTLGVGRRFNRVDLSLKGTIDRSIYSDATLADGTTFSNQDRNYNQYGGLLRGSYEFDPGVKPFVEVGVDTRVHDLDTDFAGFQRNSRGWLARVGTTFELPRRLTGELSGGYINRSYDDPDLSDVRGLIFDSSLVWYATGLTKLGLTARTAVNESNVAGTSGVLTRDIGFELSHAFRRWLVGTVKVGFGHDVYTGSPREDDRIGVSAALAYNVSREVQIKGEFRNESRKSNIPGNDYVASIFLVGLRLQP